MRIYNGYRTAGKKLGQDFFITGYDGSQLIRKVAPYLPTVIQPIKELAQQLIESILKRIAQPNIRIDNVTLPVKFYRP